MSVDFATPLPHYIQAFHIDHCHFNWTQMVWQCHFPIVSFKHRHSICGCNQTLHSTCWHCHLQLKLPQESQWMWEYTMSCICSWSRHLLITIWAMQFVILMVAHIMHVDHRLAKEDGTKTVVPSATKGMTKIPGSFFRVGGTTVCLTSWSTIHHVLFSLSCCWFSFDSLLVFLLDTTRLSRRSSSKTYTKRTSEWGVVRNLHVLLVLIIKKRTIDECRIPRSVRFFCCCCCCHSGLNQRGKLFSLFVDDQSTALWMCHRHSKRTTNIYNNNMWQSCSVPSFSSSKIFGVINVCEWPKNLIYSMVRCSASHKTNLLLTSYAKTGENEMFDKKRMQDWTTRRRNSLVREQRYRSSLTNKIKLVLSIRPWMETSAVHLSQRDLAGCCEYVEFADLIGIQPNHASKEICAMILQFHHKHQSGNPTTTKSVTRKHSITIRKLATLTSPSIARCSVFGVISLLKFTSHFIFGSGRQRISVSNPSQRGLLPLQKS